MELRMLLADLRAEVATANRELSVRGLAIATFGNVSGLDRASGVMAIKPSGVPYASLTAADIVLVNVATGRVIDGILRPSSDAPTHCALYRGLRGIAGIVHVHSPYATAWCQAGRPLPCFGTTHADYCVGEVPVTAPLLDSQVAGAYEEETGNNIIAALAGRDPVEVPMVLVHGHAPFAWSGKPSTAVEHAVILEELARMALMTIAIAPAAAPIAQAIGARHWRRKHGATSTYGQMERSAPVAMMGTDD